VNRDALALPATRSWRDIPQQVKARAMSKEGRRRKLGQTFGVFAGFATLAAIGWVGWQVASVELHAPRPAAVSADAEPIGDHLTLTSDGVLNNDVAWLKRTLALPKDATVTGLDLKAAEARVKASGQIASAAIVVHFPSTLSVIISERSPAVRIMAQAPDGSSRTLLVAPDGVVFDGVNYDPAVIASLPWLDGVRLVRRGQGFDPIAGMDAVNGLLVSGRLDAPDLYRTWEVVSLARFSADGQLEVRTRDGVKVIFGTQEEFFPQLVRLFAVLEKVSANPEARASLREINLSLGRRPNGTKEVDVPVSFSSFPKSQIHFP
jgi:hypothetical protein